jgi:hypothetical protein
MEMIMSALLNFLTTPLGKNRNFRWCCHFFQEYCERGGERGMAVLVVAKYTGPGYSFGLQWRSQSVETQIENPFTPVFKNKEFVPKEWTDVTVLTIDNAGIIFCPWCSRNLVQWYGKTAKEIARDDLKLTI